MEELLGSHLVSEAVVGDNGCENNSKINSYRYMYVKLIVFNCLSLSFPLSFSLSLSLSLSHAHTHTHTACSSECEKCAMIGGVSRCTGRQ